MKFQCVTILFLLKKSFGNGNTIPSWLAKQKEACRITHHLLTPSLESSRGHLKKCMKRGIFLFMNWLDSQIPKIRNYLDHLQLFHSQHWAQGVQASHKAIDSPIYNELEECFPSLQETFWVSSLFYITAPLIFEVSFICLFLFFPTFFDFPFSSTFYAPHM